MPAKAGIQLIGWVPAFAGTTKEKPGNAGLLVLAPMSAFSDEL
jgi:hypothetical protein